MAKNCLTWIDENIDRKTFEGKNVFITGGNSGIGFELAKQCAYLGSNVFLLCRSVEKAETAKQEILKEYPSCKVEIIHLDLADLSSIKECAEVIKKLNVDMFVNNAGVYRLERSETKDGFEIIIGTNFIGTYYLNKLLFDYFKSLNHKVNVLLESSIVAKYSKIDFDDLFMDKHYSKMKIYARSKLAINAIFDHFCEINDSDNLNFVLAHPGIAFTPLIVKAYNSHSFQLAAKKFMRAFFNSPTVSALSLLEGLTHYQNYKVGPGSLFGTKGYPKEWKIKTYPHYKRLISLADDMLNEKLK